METETSIPRSRLPRPPEFSLLVPESPARDALVAALSAALRDLAGGPWHVTIREHATEGLATGRSAEVWSVEIGAGRTRAMTLVRPAVEPIDEVVQRIRGILGA